MLKKKKNESLIKALQERDEELARLNSQMTNNRLTSKQQQSNISLLTQEKEAQAELVQSLEKQAENTLQLHTKIAEQSTELEDLRARLFQRDNTTGTRGRETQIQAGLKQPETHQTTSSKPRVFVRPDADTEALTGATGYQTQQQRPRQTADGYRIQNPDGTDDLSLLPGVNYKIAGALSKYGITTFEQVASWGDREIAHYAERVGLPVQSARQYNWSMAAKSILNGTYIKAGQEIDH